MAEETNTQQVEIRDYAIDEYVPMEARYYGAKEMTSTWICANANPTTWYMGTILGALGLGGALLSAIIGNPLVYLILALVGIIGYKVASTNMGLCRVSFGIAGSKLPSFINALQFVGWCGVNTYIAATPLATLLCSIFGGDPHSPIMLIISVFIILLITTFVSVYGAKYTEKRRLLQWRVLQFSACGSVSGYSLSCRSRISGNGRSRTIRPTAAGRFRSAAALTSSLPTALRGSCARRTIRAIPRAKSLRRLRR